MSKGYYVLFQFIPNKKNKKSDFLRYIRFNNEETARYYAQHAYDKELFFFEAEIKDTRVVCLEGDNTIDRPDTYPPYVKDVYLGDMKYL